MKFYDTGRENLLPIPLKQIFLHGAVNNICLKDCLNNFKIKNSRNKNTLALADITNIQNFNTELDVRR